MDTLRRVNGFDWPESDIACSLVIFDETDAIDKVLQYVKERRVVLQAGGNCGVWPKRLAKEFRVVYSLEPDSENFYYLTRNCPEKNIVKIQAALGESHGMSGMQGSRKNCGEYWMEGRGAVPVLRIDDFNFDYLDLVTLDIEGFEIFAIRGGREQLTKHKPPIICENKGKSWKYGFDENDVDRELETLGYERVAEHRNDKIYLCK